MLGWRDRGLTYDALRTTDLAPLVAASPPWEPTAEEKAAIAAAVKGDCVHYRGTRGPCAAGVDLRALVGGGDDGWCTRLPCLELFRRRANGPTAACALFRVPTAEEERAGREEDARTEARMKLVMPVFGRLK
jgi:hypothetical protein